MSDLTWRHTEEWPVFCRFCPLWERVAWGTSSDPLGGCGGYEKSHDGYVRTRASSAATEPYCPGVVPDA